MKNGLEFYDFKDEDEHVELAAAKCLGKFKNPSLDNPAALKYQLLECVAQGSDVPKKEIGSLSCIDTDAFECDRSCENAITCASLGTVREDFAGKEGNSGLNTTSPSNSQTHEQDLYSKKDNYESRSSFTEQEPRFSCHESPSPPKSQLNCDLSYSSSGSEPVDVNSDADESMGEGFPSSPPPNIAEDVILNGHTPTNCFSNSEMGDINIAVDYVVYRDNYCPGCLVTFSCNGIKIHGSTAHENQETFSFESGIEDILRIESQHIQRFEALMIKLRILSKDAVQADNAFGTTGIEELEFAVFEPNWPGKWEEITSLNGRYSAIWGVMHDMDVTMDGGADFIQQRSYFPNFDEAFEDVVYPKGDSDAVSICRRDVDLLQPETFINDTIIDFYIKYLKNQIPPEEKPRFHFFNSFFFRKLADLDKDPSSASDGRAAFLRVHKWTRKVDIFGKDYVFIPVNFNLHWSLLVICHPGEVAVLKDEETVKSEKVPCILHMDSIKGTHAGLKTLVQSYLWEEWKVRQKETSEELSTKFLNLRFVSLELPQQENSFDCGLFLLHYLELFLVEAPVNFSPFKINEFSKFLNVDWFPPAEASLKRTLIQRLISELLENRSREIHYDCSDEPETDFPEDNEKQTGVELISERCTSSLACHGNLSSSEAGQGIEITLLEASSMRTSQCVNDPGLVLRDLFEPGVAAGSLLAHCSSFDQSSYYRLNGTMSQIEDEAEREQFVYFPSGETMFQPIANITPQAGSMPYSFRGFGADASWNPGRTVHAEEDDSSSETSACASDDSDVGIIENCPIQVDVGLCQKERIDQPRSISLENIQCLTDFVSASGDMLETSAVEGTGDLEGTEDLDKMHNCNENGDLTSCKENLSTSLHEDPNMLENGLHQELEKAEVIGTEMQTSGDDVIAESDEHKAYKRHWLTPSLESEEVLGLHQDLEKAEVTGDDVQTIDVMVESDEQQAAKRLRLTPPLEGELGSSLHQGLEKAEVTGDDVQTMGDDVMVESDEQKDAKRRPLPLEGKVGSSLNQGLEKAEVTEDDTQTIGDDVMVESDEQQDAKRPWLMPPLEREVGSGLNQDLEKAEVTEDDTQTIGDDVMVESDEQQDAKRLRLMPYLEGEVGSGLNQDLEKAEVTEDDTQTIGEDLMVESDEQQAAKRLRLTPGSPSNDLQL